MNEGVLHGGASRSRGRGVQDDVHGVPRHGTLHRRRFLHGWTGKSLHALFDHVSTTMPEDNPGRPEAAAVRRCRRVFPQAEWLSGRQGRADGGADAMKGITFDKKK